MTHRLIRAAAGAALVLAVAQTAARGGHIAPGRDSKAKWTALPKSGSLQYAVGPLGRYGHEWTGWVDTRHPSLAGPKDTGDKAGKNIAGYDRSDRWFRVQSTVLTDNGRDDAGKARPPQTGANNRPRDFDFANKAFIYQAGVMPIEVAKRDVTSPTFGKAGSFNFPLSTAERVAVANANNAPAPTVNLYYGDLGGDRGITRFPPNVPPHLVVSGNAVPDTFAHELYHFASSGKAVQAENPADPPHSTDKRNLIASGGIRWVPGAKAGDLGKMPPNPPFDIPNSIAVVGPGLSVGPGGAPKVGGVDQLTTPQAERIFDKTTGFGKDYFPAAQRNDFPEHGNRVDWDFVVDHARYTSDGKSFGLEGAANGADQFQGLDSLFWKIGATKASPHTGVQFAGADPAVTGHDHTGMGVFGPMADFAGPSFRTADVFSPNLRYSDSDVDAAGDQSRREEALDYDLFFQDAKGEFHPGVLRRVFIPGWSDTSTADDYLARWASPVDAVGVFILAHVGGGHDGTAQIDAVVVSQSVPAPGGLALAAAGGLALLARR
ncbi:MAG: hypothetical protein K2X87_34310, partial [Gemmataceae bacterium]|nr:hypothetical protein [Gemmataceae bacterium]